MAFPIYKLLIVGFRTASRPLNNLLIRVIKSRSNGSSSVRMLFNKFGQMAHIYEIKLNRYIVREDAPNNKKGDDQELKVYIKPLSDDAAFNKGVEYFSEVFFFYGVLILLAAYEIKRN